MLTQTFIHIGGIGHTTERRLWRTGCQFWEDALAQPEAFSFGRVHRNTVVSELKRSQEALASRNHQFFARSLKMRDAWRAFPEFRESCVYLDIETDGRAITMIGLYDGIEYVALLKDEDLGNFPDLISHYSLIVTFAGGMFDLPQLQRAFRSLRFDQIHIDLCPLLRDVNIRGGLKKIEKLAGIEREEEIAGLTGYDAVKLWRRWEQLNDRSSLDKLVAYNRADVVNLEKLMEWGYPKLRDLAISGPSSESADEEP